MLALQVTHQGQRLVTVGMALAHGLGQSQGFLRQALGAGRQLVEQLLARNLRQQLALDGLTADDHVQRGLHTNGAWQALRAASPRQQTQLDFGQRHGRARRRNAVVTAQRQLQPAAHAHPVDGRHHGLGRLLHLRNHGVQIGLLQCGFLAKLLDVRTAREGLAGTRNHDGLHGGIGIGPVETFQDGAAGGQEPSPLTGGLFSVITATDAWTLYSAVMACLLRFYEKRTGVLRIHSRKRLRQTLWSFALGLSRLGHQQEAGSEMRNLAGTRSRSHRRKTDQRSPGNSPMAHFLRRLCAPSEPWHVTSVAAIKRWGKVITEHVSAHPTMCAACSARARTFPFFGRLTLICNAKHSFA